jgi:hypothetical protein
MRTMGIESRRAARRRHLVLAAGLLALGACRSEPTRLVVLVDADLRVPDELLEVRIDVVTRSGVALAAEAFEVQRTPLPFSLGVDPGPIYADDRVVIEARALDPQGAVRVLRRSVVGFVRGETRVLSMFLSARCASAFCAEGDTCTERGCESEAVDVETLPRLEPGEELGLDAGVAPPLGPPDAGPRDAGAPDAASPDAGVGGCNPGCKQSELCLDLRRVAPCNGGADCECAARCDPFGPSAVACGVGLNCYWYDPNSADRGACIPNFGGDEHGERCTATFNANGELITDSCNGSNNTICLGVSPERRVGVCSRLCREDGRFDVCRLFTPPNVCFPVRGDGVGTCLLPPPSPQDLGRSCREAAECRTGLCQPALGQCTLACGGLNRCPDGAVCSGSADAPRCVWACATDEDCSHGGTDLHCLPLDSGGLCVRRCDEVDVCPSLGLSCDPASGRCG